MARITVQGCLDNVQSRIELILLASARARQLSTTSREPLVEWEDDKPTIVALREIEAGLINGEILQKTLEEDMLLDEFSIEKTKTRIEAV
jgi:DNA-directed RNA polymerase subunit omega